MRHPSGEWLTYQELSEWLSIPLPTLYSMTSRRQIPFHRLTPRMVRFSRSAIEAWIQARAVIGHEQALARQPVFLGISE